MGISPWVASSPPRGRGGHWGLRVPLAAPFLACAAHPPLVVSVAAVFCASVGYAATLPLQAR
jgi:hypothetical protein